MVYYKSIKVTLNALALVEVVIEAVVQYYGLLDSIVNDQGLVFTLKF